MPDSPPAAHRLGRARNHTASRCQTATIGDTRNRTSWRRPGRGQQISPVRLEFVVRPPLGAGPSPGSGRPNGHCSVRHGPPCGRRRRSTACGPSTTRGCVPRCRRPDATQRCLDPGFSERIGNSRRTGYWTSRSRWNGCTNWTEARYPTRCGRGWHGFSARTRKAGFGK